MLGFNHSKRHLIIIFQSLQIKIEVTQSIQDVAKQKEKSFHDTTLSI